MIKSFEVGPIGTNCYVFFDEETKDAMIIDPGYEDKRILNFIEENDLKLICIYLTHCHFDHIWGANWLKEATKAPIFTYNEEENNLLDIEINLSERMTGNGFTVTCDKLLFEKDEIDIGKYTFRVIHTSGHTSGSSCLYTKGILFSGDTMFKDTFGRCDLPTGSQSQIMKSIKNKLLELPMDTVVYTGHGEVTTIGEFMEIEL